MSEIATIPHPKPDSIHVGSIVSYREWSRLSGQYDGDVVVGIVCAVEISKGHPHLSIEALRDGGIFAMPTGHYFYLPAERVERVQITSHKIDSYIVNKFAPKAVG